MMTAKIKNTLCFGALLFALCAAPASEKNAIFNESFMSSTEGASRPAQWHVERNSYLEETALRLKNGHIELLSAGNKYLPIIPDVADCKVDFTASVNYSMVNSFSVELCFRYDMQKQAGQSIRLLKNKGRKGIEVSYGTNSNNRFTAVETQTLPVDESVFQKPFAVSVDVEGGAVSVEICGKKTAFKAAAGTGKIALSRGHFFDVLKISAFKISSGDAVAAAKQNKFTVPMPMEPTLFPIFCDVVLNDFGDCVEADLTFRGGVPETEPGEGNYHGMRIDILERPFFKVLEQGKTRKSTLYNDRIILVPPKLAPAYFYKVLHKKVDWPFNVKTRFFKPQTAFNLAVGFDRYANNTVFNTEQSPSETVFDAAGKVLYSGLGLTSGKIKTTFVSQPDKLAIKRLPKSDPRYEQAVNFVKNNHFFEKGETAKFSVELAARKNLPFAFDVYLEDAFFRPIKKLKTSLKKSDFKIGLNSFEKVVVDVEPIGGLNVGVYHLRIKSADPSTAEVSDYCAFEVMSGDISKPAPMVSGMPFLYNSRTETRGLTTDGFDPWLATRVDEPHYMSCANFLPAMERKYNVSKTVRALDRTYFAWIGSRDLNNIALEANKDTIKNSDYINICEQLKHQSLHWRRIYKGDDLLNFIDFCKKLNDEKIDIASLEKAHKENSLIDKNILEYVAQNYWEEWLENANIFAAKKTKDTLAKLRKDNPRLKLAQYGPAHIYGAFLKGPEFIAYLKNKYITFDENQWWQYEDYPSSCGYPIERGVYFFASCLMAMPNAHIYPEVYANSGIQGCPDGAVYYAHPPFGSREKPSSAVNIDLGLRVYEYAFASGYFDGRGFKYWDKCGFQACRFTRPWFETLIYSWRDVVENKPARPVKSAVFVSSDASRKANREMIITWNLPSVIDVRNASAECVPLIYDISRKVGVPAGFQCFDFNLLGLTENDVDTIVLPPLKGMSDEVKKHIRALHSKGVNLIASGNVDGLEDIFGVKDTGVKTKITLVKDVNNFCGGISEYSVSGRAYGTHKADGAEVLLEAEIPVLTLKRNGRAFAAFFNVYPQLVNEDRLHLRNDHGRDSISGIVKIAVSKLVEMMSAKGITTDCGKLIAFESQNNETVVLIYNPSSDAEISPVITVKKSAKIKNLKRASRAAAVLADTPEEMKLRVRLPKSGSALLAF